MMKSAHDETFFVRQPYDPVEVSPAPVGDLVEKEFRLQRDSYFNTEYIECGEVNVQEYINSFKNGCSLKSILDRCNLMPIHDKIRYLNQTADGLSADLTSIPKDGTEAQIMIQHLKSVCPDFAQRMSNGESFDKILSDYFPKSDVTAAPEQNNNESEAIS